MATIHAEAEAGGVLLLRFRGGLAMEADTDRFVSDIAQISKTIQSHHRGQLKQVKILVDMTDFQVGPDSRAFEALVNLAREDKDIVERTAIFGGTPQIQTIGQTVAYLADRDNIRFFSDKESAMRWLEGR